MDPFELNNPPNQRNINYPDNFPQVRKLLRVQKRILDKLQPNQRSFSNPELQNDDFIDDFQSFRHFLITHNFHLITNNFINKPANNSKCDLSLKIENNNDSQKPTPVPRNKNRVKKLNERKDSTVTTVSSSIDSKDGDSVQSFPDSSWPLTTASFDRNSNLVENLTISEMVKNQSFEEENLDFKVEYNYPKSFQQQPQQLRLSIHTVPIIEMPTVKTPIKVKNTKNSFRHFLKMNKITTNKFLSLRNRNNSNDSNNRKSLVDLVNPEIDVYKPRRPTRDPPPPPILVFRPAAPLPVESCSASSTGNDTFSDTISELYHDSANLYDAEGIYCSVDEENVNKANANTFYDHDIDADTQKCNDEDPSANNNNNKFVNEKTKCEIFNNTNIPTFPFADNDDYYDDGLCIYEELSSNEGTIYEDYGQEEIIYDNAEFVEMNHRDTNDKKYLKQMKKMEKMMKRFNLTGEEIPVNAGVVKENCKGSKNDLYVRKDETVLILRMENNPPGKWLAKNERSKIGYIDLNNVTLETDSIKAAFQAFK